MDGDGVFFFLFSGDASARLKSVGTSSVFFQTRQLYIYIYIVYEKGKLTNGKSIKETRDGSIETAERDRLPTGAPTA